MAGAQGPFLVAVLLLVCPGTRCSSAPPACPELCTCQRAPLLNCSSSGLSSAPQHIHDSVTELDLSHNLLGSVALPRPRRNLRNVLLGNNSIAHLSLCIDMDLGNRSGRHPRRPGPRSRRRCVSWAPTLQLLSVERNQLVQLPEGLEGSASLRVLQLSFNGISTLRPGDLSHLRQLEELHLQHNLITSLHPEMFQDLAQLRVLDLSFNMLTSLHPLTYLSLRNIGSDVRLAGNRWQCDCSVRSLARRMAYDRSRGLRAWGMVCAFPSTLSGRDLLQLEEDELNCVGTEDSPELHRDVTVHGGSGILLSCSKQDSLWWTPSGQASVSQPQAALFISDVTERDTGLYVCMSEEHEVVSVFNLQISRIGPARRKTRSLPRTSRQEIPRDDPNRIDQGRNQRVTQSDLALAVCLSILFTFLIAFIFGVLARPCIDVHCLKYTNTKSSTSTNSSAEQRQYENEAYSNGEEPEEIVTHRDRRVKFGTVNFREDIDVEYYNTVASGNQESITDDAVIEYEVARTEEHEHTAGDSRSENSSIPEDNQRYGRDIYARCTKKKVEYEHTSEPAEPEDRRSASSCSDYSLSDREFQKDQMTQGDLATPKSLQLADESVHQRLDLSTSNKVEVHQMSLKGSGENPGNNSNPTELDRWQEDEEQFEFSDSARSSVLPTSDNQNRDDVSSCSPYLSDDEPTHYDVNPDLEEEEDTENNRNKSEVTNARLKHDDTQRPEQTFSSQPSDSDSEQMAYTIKEKGEEKSMNEYNKLSSRSVTGETDTREKIKPKPRTKWRGVSLGVTSFGKSLDTRAPSPPTAYSSSSSIESEAEITGPRGQQNKGRVSQIKNNLDIIAPLPASDSSSSDEIKDETTKHTKKRGRGDVYMTGLISEEYQSIGYEDRQITPKRGLDIRASSMPTDESADRTMDYVLKQREMHMTKLQFQESQTASHDSDTRWPALDLEHIPPIKGRLDIKAPSPPPDSSSSSDSQDETTGHTEKHISGLLLKESQATSHDSGTRWPALDLEHIPHIKRGLDIKSTSLESDLSSGGISEDETTHHADRPGTVDIAKFPLQKSQTRHDPDAKWPSLDLEHIPPIKRRLDIKAPSMDSDSCSGSDSEDETTQHAKRPGKVSNAELPLQKYQTTSHDPDAKWPALDLECIPRIKERLDIKAPSPPPDSSSSSDSEDETTHHADRPGTVDIAKFPLQKSQTRHDPDAKWPALDLEHIPPIKRRLDIKATSPPPDSSSSDDSQDETTGHTEKQISGLLLKESQTASHDSGTRWPALDLEHIPHIKRRLDIKAPSPPPDSSSGSDSEDETTHHADRPGTVDIAKFPLQKSQTRHDPDAKWPSLDLERIPRIKRRLDIKAPSMDSDSSSGSDSEDETTHQAKRPEKVSNVKLPLQKSETTRHDPDAKWPALDLEHIPRIKRRLDIRVPSPPPDSSSSSDSEDETTHHAGRPGTVDIAKFPLQKSQTTRHDPDAKWPALDLEHIPPIKRRLDIKAPSPPPDSSSSSDSQDETTGHTEKHISGLLLKESQTASHDSGTRWPALDLEHIPHIKRRLDIKAPSPPPDSSSGSDSEDETTHQAKRPEKVSYVKLPLQKSETTRHDPDAKWPALDLEHIPRIKRRLDIKAPSPPPDSSSSDDSQDETTGHTEKHIPGLLLKESQATSHDSGTRWPALDLEHIPHIKRRLDFKAPSLDLDSFSSSYSEDTATDHTKKQRPGVVNRNSCSSGSSSDEQDDMSNSSINPDPRWPELGLSSVPLVKRRLDIKTYSPSTEYSSSSDNSDSGTTDLSVKGGTGITTHEQRTMLHKMNLGIPNISRRLDIKAPSPQPDLVLDSISVDYQQSGSNSSKRESEGENRDHNAEVGVGVTAISKAVERSPKTPVINISPHPKTDHNIKLEKYTVITNDLGGKETDDNISTTPEINPELQSRWASMNLGISRFRKHLDITSNSHVAPNLPTSPSPDSPSSWSSESGTGNQSSGTRRGDGMQDILHTDSSLSLENKPVKVNALKSRDHKDYSPPTIKVKSSPGTALTGFGTPYVRRYLDIRVSEKAPASPPLHQLPDSSSSSQSEGVSTESAGNRWRGTSQQSVVPDGAAPQNSTSLFVARAVDVRPEYHSGTEEVERKAEEEGETSDSMRPHLTLTNIPYVKRALDIRAPLQRELSSKSNSEDETTDFRVPNLNFVVPRLKRRLDFKAPSPEPSDSSSSCNESGNEVTGYKGYQSREASNMSEITDYDSQITYKRSILNGPTTLGNSFSPSQTTGSAEMFTVTQGSSHTVGFRNASPAPWGVPSGDIVKKWTEPQHTTDEELPPEIRWTGIGRHLSGFPMSSQRTLETAVEKVGLPSPQQASPAEPELSPPVSSRIDSDDNIKQDRGRADVPLMHKYSYPIASRVSPAPSRAFDRLDNTSGSTNEIFKALSADREGKKGLGALKTMSSKRLQWDTEDRDIDGV